jgi:hypothetical protein
MKFRFIGQLIIIWTLTTSCVTYYITTDSLKKQFSGVDSTDLKLVSVRGPAGDVKKYLATPIEVINCVDKNGNSAPLTNSPSIEMRVTLNNGRRPVFYFDRIFVTDSTLYGIQSRFVHSIDKTIKLRDIKKIEVQDGKKNFRYVTR